MDHSDAASSAPAAYNAARNLIPSPIINSCLMSMGSGSITHPDFLPRQLVEEDIASLLLLGIHLHWFRQSHVFRKPHLELGVKPPVAIRS